MAGRDGTVGQSTESVLSSLPCLTLGVDAGVCLCLSPQRKGIYSIGRCGDDDDILRGK